MSCCACFVVLTGFAGAFKMPCSHLQAWQGRHHSSACVKCPSNCMCSGFVDLKLLDSEPLTTCALLFFVEILAMNLDISCSLVLVFILPVAERGQISRLAVKIITSACVVCLNESMWTGSFSMLSQHCHWSWCHAYFLPWTWAFSGGSGDSWTQVPFPLASNCD